MGSGKSVMPPTFGGRTLTEIDPILRSETNEKAVVSTIGQAGEKQVLISCHHDGW